MFNKWESLLSLSDNSIWNNQNINDTSDIFSDCESFSSLPDISKWNTQNVNDMNDICFAIVYLYYLYLIFQNGILKM